MSSITSSRLLLAPATPNLHTSVFPKPETRTSNPETRDRDDERMGCDTGVAFDKLPSGAIKERLSRCASVLSVCCIPRLACLLLSSEFVMSAFSIPTQLQTRNPKTRSRGQDAPARGPPRRLPRTLTTVRVCARARVVCIGEFQRRERASFSAQPPLVGTD